VGTWKAVADALVKVYHESPRFMAAICIVCFVLLCLPLRTLSALGLQGMVLKYHAHIVLVFMFSSAMLLSYPIEYVARNSHGWAMDRIYWKRIKERLHNLSEDEKHVLRPYITNNKRTNYFYLNNGTVAELCLCRILYIPNTRYLMSHVPHTMSDRVWKYLHKHPELLT
jgi:Super-infection exclusion protein B